MQIEAIYDHGQVKFDHPIRLAKERFPIILDVPDSILRPEPKPAANLTGEQTDKSDGKRLLGEIRDILGPLSKARASTSSADDKAALSEALAEKYDQ